MTDTPYTVLVEYGKGATYYFVTGPTMAQWFPPSHHGMAPKASAEQMVAILNAAYVAGRTSAE